MSIRLRSGGLSFSAYDPSVSESFVYRDMEFDRSKPYVAALKDCFFENEFFAWPYRRINVIFAFSRYQLVPEEVFLDSRKGKLMDFAFSSFSGHCLSNAWKEEQAMLVFEVEEEIYEFCSRSLVNPRFIHYLSPLLPLWKRLSRRSESRQMYAMLSGRRMDIACYAQGNLLFVNTFDYEQPDDLLYYILYVWKQTGMDPQKDRLRLSGDMTLRTHVVNALRTYLLYIDPLEMPSEAYLMGPEVLQAPLDLIALSLCES